MTTLTAYDLGLLHYSVWSDWSRARNTAPPPQYTPDTGDADAMADFRRGLDDARNGDDRAVAVAFARLDGVDDDAYLHAPRSRCRCSRD